MSRLRTALAVTALLAVSGCGTEAEPEAKPTTDKPSASEPVDSAPKVATCKLGKGDVKLEQNDDEIVMTFNGHPVPETGTVLYSATLYPASGENGRQLGIKYTDSVLVGYFAFDYNSAEQANIDGEPDRGPAQVSGTFPRDELGELGEDGAATWSATLSVNGNDVARCPAGTDSNNFPS